MMNTRFPYLFIEAYLAWIFIVTVAPRKVNTAKSIYSVFWTASSITALKKNLSSKP